jgi:hypothetical protein
LPCGGADLAPLLPGQSPRLLADIYDFCTVILFKNWHFKHVCPGFKMFLGPPLAVCLAVRHTAKDKVCRELCPELETEFR